MVERNAEIESIIDTYLKGWELGDGSLSLSVTASGFYYEDPNTGRIERNCFVEFVEDFKRAAAEMLDGEAPRPFLEYRDIVVKHEPNASATVWCWWRVRNTSLEGSALVKVNAEGVQCERIAYFSKLPDDDIGPNRQAVENRR